MAQKIPPAPIGALPGSSYWNDWYEKLRNLINSGTISQLWSSIDFTASNITDIVTRAHNNLQSFQGGTGGEYYHLTAAQHTNLTPPEWVWINAASDFPAAVAGVRTLVANTTYVITTTVDLVGDRLVCAANTTIIGGSSENCRLKSTGLASALITSAYSLPMRSVTIEAAIALNLDATANAGSALDWFGVNFTSCAVVGTIKGYSNVIWTDCALIDSANLTFDGTIGTVGFSGCLLSGLASQTTIIVPATLIITRRFRLIYTAVIAFSAGTGINVSASATIPDEGYILDTVSFAGGATYVAGVTSTSNTALFLNCVGITNTSANGGMYMQNNATATTVSASNTFYKVAGTTTANADNAKFSHSSNRLTCDATINRKYLLLCTVAFTTTAGNVCEFSFYDSQSAAVLTPSRTKATANAAGRAESVTIQTFINMDDTDYIEIHCANTTAANNITVTDMNVTITQI